MDKDSFKFAQNPTDIAAAIKESIDKNRGSLEQFIEKHSVDNKINNNPSQQSSTDENTDLKIELPTSKNFFGDKKPFEQILRGIISLPIKNRTGIYEKIGILKERLLEKFVEREVETLGILSGLFANEPVIMIGPYGTAKTNLIEAMAGLSSAKYFYYLLNPYTEPDALLGPIDIKAYKRRGEFKRSTKGGVQEGEILFMDEPFKASNAIRNILLDIMLNNRYKNGNEDIALPRVGIYFAANEIPEEQDDAAFYDRLTLKVFVDYISRKGWAELLLRKGQLDEDAFKEQNSVISTEDIRKIQKEVRHRYNEVYKNVNLIGKYIDVQSSLADDNENNNNEHRLSDRMRKKILKIAASVSVIFGDEEIKEEHLAVALHFCVPKKKEHVEIVDNIILNHELSPTYSGLHKLGVVATELYNYYTEVKKSEGIDTSNFSEKVEKLDELIQKTEEVCKAYHENLILSVYENEVANLVHNVQKYRERIMGKLADKDHNKT